MTVKRTLNEIVEVMINNNIPLSSIKNVLLDLGFPSDKVEKVIEAYKFMERQIESEGQEVNGNEGINSSPNNSPSRENDGLGSDLRASLITLESELKRQKEVIDKIEQELMKSIIEIGELKKRLHALEETRASRNIEQEVKALKARLDALIDIIIDNAPALIEEFKRRGLR
ncbi:MAG: hypothetical protein DRZ82_04305 [Thermoprotei archaeon]|nr:MAG: hypothetical protein DRZ82_04305 [Thermoprotei archaeon]